MNQRSVGPRSLRGRLVLGAVCVGIVFAILFGVVATWQVHRTEDLAIGAALQTRLELARDQVRPDGSLGTEPVDPRTDLVQVIGADGSIVASSPALRGVGPLAQSAVVAGAPRGVVGAVALTAPDIDLATLAVPTQIMRPGRAQPEAAVLVVAVDTEGFGTADGGLTTLLVGGLAAVVLVLAGLAWFVSGRTLRSVNQLTERAERLHPSDASGGLTVPDGDAELGRLVLALNRMLARLHAAHTAELTFLAEAGHRLRTPVATLRAEAELALLDPDRDHRTTALQAIMADADLLTMIVDRLLSRTRRRRSGSMAVGAALDACARRWRRQGRLAGLDLRVVQRSGLPGTLPCEALDDILDPLVDNALRHGAGGSRVDVVVGLTARGTEVVVEVANSGDPIPSELVPHVFDAWVSSRPGSEAGGLGLWTARETARALGGDVALGTSQAGRTTFVALLPVAPPIPGGPS